MIDHTGHPHPSTPAARALCRANGGTGSIAKKPDKKKAPAKRAPAKVAPRSVMHLETGRTITREEAARIMHGTKPAVAKVTPKKAPAPVTPRAKKPVAEKRRVTDIQKGDKVYGNVIGGVHTVDKVVTSRTDLRINVGHYSLRDSQGREFFVGSTNSKVKMAEGSVPDITRQVETPADPMASSGLPSVPSNSKINQSMKSGITGSATLSGGAIAETDLVRFKDGSRGVRKRTSGLPPEDLAAMEEDNPGSTASMQTAKKQQDAEELAPLLARMMGLTAPQVHREDENTVVMEHFTGTVGADLEFGVAEHEDTDQGALIGLLDQVIGNVDRNDGNFIVNERTGKIALIDHGLAWSMERNPEGKPGPAQRTVQAFSERFLQKDKKTDMVSGWKDNDIHPDDIKRVTQMVLALKPEFEKRGQSGWWLFSLQQLGNLAPHAKGTIRRLK